MDARSTFCPTFRFFTAEGLAVKCVISPLDTSRAVTAPVFRSTWVMAQHGSPAWALKATSEATTARINLSPWVFIDSSVYCWNKGPIPGCSGEQRPAGHWTPPRPIRQAKGSVTKSMLQASLAFVGCSRTSRCTALTAVKVIDRFPQLSHDDFARMRGRRHNGPLTRQPSSRQRTRCLDAVASARPSARPVVTTAHSAQKWPTSGLQKESRESPASITYSACHQFVPVSANESRL